MNYLYSLNKDYLKEPHHIDYGLGRGVICEKLYIKVLQELNIDKEDVGHFSFLDEVKDLAVTEKIIKNLCLKLNELGQEVRSLQASGILKLIIMEIWFSLKNFYKENEREKALEYLLELIDNYIVVEQIELMNLYFKQHHFREDPSKSQF